jgi:hypothetical protein
MNTNHHSINHLSANNTLEDSKVHLKVILTIIDPLVLFQADGEANLNIKNQLHNGTEMLVLVFMHPDLSLVFQEDGVKSLKSKRNYLNLLHLML